MPPYVWMPPCWTPSVCLDTLCMFGCPQMLRCPLVCSDAPIYLYTPILLDAPCMSGHPHMFGCPHMFEHPPVCFNAPGHPHMYGHPPVCLDDKKHAFFVVCCTAGNTLLLEYLVLYIVLNLLQITLRSLTTHLVI